MSELLAIVTSLQEEVLPLSELEIHRFAPLVTHAKWDERSATLSDDEIVGLIKVFTLGEMQFPPWAAGEKSAVIPLVKELKRRQRYDKALTRWIKDHTDNRFLPHGSLMDRL